MSRLASFFTATVFAFTLAAPFAFAQSDYVVSDAFVRASPSKTTAAYITVENTGGKDDALVKASADWAERVELHNVTKDDKGVMKMFQVDSIALPANGKMVLQPGSYHIMIFGVKDALQENTEKTLTLEFANGKTMTQDFTVKPISFMGKKDDAQHDAQHHGDHGH